MARLSSIKPRLASLRAPLARRTDDHGHDRAAEPWRKWYSTARWQRLRLATFERDQCTCQDRRCGRLEGDPSKLICDHILPHRGDPKLFWSAKNLQTLCKPCHDGRKQAQERRGGG